MSTAAKTSRALAAAIVALLAAVTLGGAQRSESPEVLFRRAVDKEIADADFTGAIELYRKVVEAPGVSRALAAEALVGMGQSYQRLGNAGEASKMYERVLRDYAGETASALKARIRLDALSGGAIEAQARLKVPTGSLELPRPQLVCRNCGQGSVTPDGVLVIVNARTLEVRDLSKGSRGEVTRWMNAKDLAMELVDQALISPDGKQIAMTPTLDETLALLPNVAGSLPSSVRIPAGSLIDDIVGWSQDGKSLLIAGSFGAASCCNLGWISIADGSARKLEVESVRSQYGGTTSLSPDGKFIAYLQRDPSPEQNSRGRGRLGMPYLSGDAPRGYIVTADGLNKTPLVTGPLSFPRWTPDGKRILFTSAREGTVDLWSIAVREGKPSGSPAILFKDIGGVPLRNGITRDGILYYTKAAKESNRVTVVDMEAAGGKIRGSAPHIIGSLEGRSPTLSPNGKFVVYERRQTSPSNLTPYTSPGRENTLFSLETGKETALDLIPGARGGHRVAWFRDSSAFLEWGQQGARGAATFALYRVDVANGKSTMVVQTDSPVGGIALSPDEKTVYSVTQPDGPPQGPPDFVAFDLQTGQRRTVYTPAGQVVAWALSHDGRALTMALHQPVVSRTLSIARVGVDGADYRVLFTSTAGAGRPSSLTWTADDRNILFVDWNVGRVMRIPANGGTPQSTGIDIEGPHETTRLSLSADGSRLVYSEVMPGTEDIWSLDLSSQLGK